MDIAITHLKHYILNVSLLKLNGHCINNNDLTLIVDELPQYPYLKSIDLSNNQITKNGLIHLTQALNKTCPNIKAINLSFNPLGNECLKELKQNQWAHQTFLLNTGVENDDLIEAYKTCHLNQKLYRKKLAFFLNASISLCQGHRQNHTKLSELDSNMILTILHYLADVDESRFNISLLCFTLLSDHCQKNKKRTSLDLEKAIHMTQHFYPKHPFIPPDLNHADDKKTNRCCVIQ